jgi:putative transposase
MTSRYDPSKHHRRSIRLREYDYASPGAYFVTIVTHDRECLFDGDVFRRVAEWNWKAIARHFENVALDEWIVMPNHIHGIIIITDTEAARARVTRKGEAFVKDQFSPRQGWDIPTKVSKNQDLTNAPPLPAHGVPPGALGTIVGNFKSVTTRRINDVRRSRGATIWHRNYYEHIVRSERESNRIREYIAANPCRWEHDIDNPSYRPAIDAWLADEKIWFSKSNLKSSHD